jgi:hypothetical protein
MQNDLSKDHFNCPHCGVNNVTYEKISSVHEVVAYKTGVGKGDWIEYVWGHYVVKCRREECGRLTYIKVKEQFSEPVGLLSSSSVMCRKVIYEICDKQKSDGKDYKEKINNLGFDKRITDPLLNIKNIGDETVHAKSWDKVTIQKAIEALGIIIEMIYTQENRIKEFSKHYSKTKQERQRS